jgi:putative heme-binding domain-containing protein
LSQPNRTAMMLQAMEDDWLSKFEPTSAQIRTLFARTSESLVPGRLAVLYGKAPPNNARQQMVDRFMPATQLAGRANSGRVIFLARCATCHQVGGEGNPFGEKLDGTRSMEKSRLLIKIIDPNREPPTKYPMTLVETSAGETLTGFVVAETGKSITLCQANGDNRVIARSNTVTRRSLGFSAMPEGLEAGLSQPDMADLLAYLGGQEGQLANK